jgi:hypothetical protein
VKMAMLDDTFDMELSYHALSMCQLFNNFSVFFVK